MPKTLGQLATEVLRKKYEKPNTGIPKTDLEDSIEQELEDLADQVDDVQVNGVSIVQNGVANVPRASNGIFGVVRIAGSDGIAIANNGDLYIDGASDTVIKNGVNRYKPILPSTQHMSTFYGLAKAAGIDLSSSDNSVGTYTDAAKTAIQNMLGILPGTEVVRLI